MTVFTEAELVFLRNERLLGRLATVAPNGMPHISPIGWRLADEAHVIEVTGRDLEATKKYRDVARTGRAAIVIDDVLPPWQPRGIEVRGRAEAVAGSQAVIRIYPTRIHSWGFEGATGGRDVPAC